MNATPFNQHTHGGHTAYPDDHTFILAQPLIIRTAPEWTALTDPPQTLPAGSLVHYTKHIRTKMHSYIKLTTGYLPTADLRTHHQYGADSDPTTSLVPAIEPVLGHRYPLKGQFRLTQQRLDEHTAPSLTAPVLRTFKQGATIPYTAKLRTKHYGWLEVPHAAGNGYLPFLRYVAGIATYYGREKTGSKIVTRLVEPWTYDHSDRIRSHEDPRVPLRPTAEERGDFAQLASKIAKVAQPDTVLIGLINDTHFDSYNTEASAGTLRDLKAVSYFAKNYGLDAIVANGDLNDGVQTLDRTILDINRAVAALKLSETPFFITQGNHDDNSGFARYENGYCVEQVLANQAACHLRNQHDCAQQIMPKSAEPAFYGKYRVSNSPISVVLLDTFDIPDSAVNGYFKRNYDEAPSGLQWTGILQNIRHSRSRIRQVQADWFSQTMATLAPEEQVIVFTHDSIRSAITDDAVDGFWTYDWFANNQQGAYAQVYKTLVAHRDQVISVMSGHTHVDDWSHDDGLNWITTTCDAPNRRKTGHSRHSTASDAAWDVLVINPTERHLSRFRYGWQDGAGSESRFRFALFGDGTDNRVPSLREKLNKLRPAAVTRNTILYNQKSKQSRQSWRGFRSGFDY